MMRSKASKDSSRGFQVSSEISFLISVRKAHPISGQTADLTSKIFCQRELNAPVVKLASDCRIGLVLFLGPVSV